ncbi:MAG: hypothetical protein H8F28_16110 [Fibrella sp.]|nr:hypothetical protein [Armatimonadota bacterium]
MASFSEAVSVNDEGVVAGWSDQGVTPDDVPDLRMAMVWQNGKYETIPPPPDYPSSEATWCDGFGNVWGKNFFRMQKTGLWKSERFVTRKDKQGRFAQTSSLQDGSVPVCSSREGGVTLAVSKDGRKVIWRGGTGRAVIPLSASAGRVADAVCNDRGNAAVTFSIYTKESSETWRNTDVLWAESWTLDNKDPKRVRGKRVLPPLRGFPICAVAAMNDSHDDMVGVAYSRVPGGRSRYFPRDSRAVLWKQDGTVLNLSEEIVPNSGWVLSSANGINDRGYIVGTGILNGSRNGFLLTPNPKYHAPNGSVSRTRK